jgi:ABC-type phosphate transport system substrate-binding protein
MRITKYSAVVGTVAILAGLLVFPSCGGGEKAADRQTEAAVEQALKATTGKDADVKIDGKSVEITGAGSTHEFAETAEWPADMFEGVPKFTFGKIERVSKGQEGGMMKFNIYFRDIEKGGIERYVDLLKEAGWQADLNIAGGKGGVVGGEKGGLGLNFMFSIEDGTGMLAVFSGLEK